MRAPPGCPRSASRTPHWLVAIGEATLKAGGEARFAFPGYLLNRSSIELASGNLEQASVDANRALTFLGSNTQPNSFSSTLGYAHLGVARTLDAQGKRDKAREEAALAAENLEKCLGPDHPDTRAARQLASLDPAHR